MFDEHRFSNDGTEASRPCQSDHGDDQMYEQDEEVAHPGNGINTSKSHDIQAQVGNSPRTALPGDG
jgi:hypothetical protein